MKLLKRKWWQKTFLWTICLRLILTTLMVYNHCSETWVTSKLGQLSLSLFEQVQRKSLHRNNWRLTNGSKEVLSRIIRKTDSHFQNERQIFRWTMVIFSLSNLFRKEVPELILPDSRKLNNKTTIYRSSFQKPIHQSDLKNDKTWFSLQKRIKV